MPAASTMRKITISLPSELVAFADQRAEEVQTSRSQVISQILTEAKVSLETQLAAQGYQFYAKELAEFAEASAGVVSGDWSTENWLDLQPEDMQHAS